MTEEERIAHRDYMRAYRQTDTYKQYRDSEAYKESQRKYKKTAKGKAASRRYAKTDKAKVVRTKYKSTEQGKITVGNARHKRRAIIKDAGSYTLQEWKALVDYYNHTCLGCGCNDYELTVDHVLPLAKGGDNTINNIQPLCLPCNLIKHAKHIDYR